MGGGVNTGPASGYLRLSPSVSAYLRLSPSVSGNLRLYLRLYIDLAFAPPMLSSVMGGPQMPGSSIEARMHCADSGKFGEFGE
eukprot:scaffold92528_cov51-Phaeocystis_antarctica.AAC.1